MLSKLRFKRYKSLFDVEIDLEPLTVFIGPNGSGKSNICEALVVLSDFLRRITEVKNQDKSSAALFDESLRSISNNVQDIKSKFWQGYANDMMLSAISNSIDEGKSLEANGKISDINVLFFYPEKRIEIQAKGYTISPQDLNANSFKLALYNHDYINSSIGNSLKNVSVYDFAPFSLSENINNNHRIDRSGGGTINSLVDILHLNRDAFDELEQRLITLIPNIKKILLPRDNDKQFSLQLVDRYSNNRIPVSEISDGTLRILAFLTALYQDDAPSIICFEEIENGVHPWLLHKMMEILKIVSTEGITGHPVQILITTHSPLLLNYVEPNQVRAVELDPEGKTQIHKLPTDSVRFQKALEAYDGALGELWFTNVFGGNPA